MEHFGIKLKKSNLEKMRDKHGTIHFYLVFDWLLPMFNDANSFDEDGFYTFVAARMRNYMIEIIRKQAFKPDHYDPFDEKYITAHHIVCFFGCQLVCGIRGLPLVYVCWSTHEALDAIVMAKENMTCGAFLDMQQCIHFANNRGNEVGDV